MYNTFCNYNTPVPPPIMVNQCLTIVKRTAAVMAVSNSLKPLLQFLTIFALQLIQLMLQYASSSSKSSAPIPDDCRTYRGSNCGAL